MKDKNLTNDYDNHPWGSHSWNEFNYWGFRKPKKLRKFTEKYQNLLKLNNIIEKKFQKEVKYINEKTKKGILDITSKIIMQKIK